MEYTAELRDGVCHVVMDGAFTFDDHRTFKKILKMYEKEDIKRLELCFRDITRIDSSALGVLLMLSDEAEKRSGTITLVCDRDNSIEKIFRICEFDKLFDIDYQEVASA